MVRVKSITDNIAPASLFARQAPFPLKNKE